jgi:Family of unknown function (DUF5763)
MQSTGNKCKGTTKKGKPCSAAATNTGLCYFHSNPNRAAELGRLGGRNNRYACAGPDTPPLAIGTATELGESVTRITNELHSGKLSPSIATALTGLLTLQLRANHAADLEKRLAEQQNQILELKQVLDTLRTPSASAMLIHNQKIHTSDQNRLPSSHNGSAHENSQPIHGFDGSS